MQQRLGRNAADVQAGTAETAALVDAGAGKAQLPQPDRRIIAAGAAPDHNCVETVRHGPAHLIFEPEHNHPGRGENSPKRMTGWHFPALAPHFAARPSANRAPPPFSARSAVKGEVAAAKCRR